ncbi:hypothetical protein [Bacillus sp. 7894-2]|nr:hypothetical protein [Bacillus sp. 7894-2]
MNLFTLALAGWNAGDFIFQLLPFYWPFLEFSSSSFLFSREETTG